MVRTWFFDGKNVVECMVKRGDWTVDFLALKFSTFLKFIFVHSRNGMQADAEKQISPLRRSQRRERLRSK
jgi:hypothetical protein